jgi:hypothetical protein
MLTPNPAIGTPLASLSLSRSGRHNLRNSHLGRAWAKHVGTRPVVWSAALANPTPPRETSRRPFPPDEDPVSALSLNSHHPLEMSSWPTTLCFGLHLTAKCHRTHRITRATSTLLASGLVAFLPLLSFYSVRPRLSCLGTLQLDGKGHPLALAIPLLWGYIMLPQDVNRMLNNFVCRDVFHSRTLTKELALAPLDVSCAWRT